MDYKAWMTQRPIWLPWALFAGALAIAAWSLWPRSPSDVIGTTLAAFEKQNKLIVFSARLTPVVNTPAPSVLHRLTAVLDSKQVAVIPARVDYALDLSAIGKDRFDWDPKGHSLSVRLPPLIIERPNLDEGRAQYLQDGMMFPSTVIKLTQENSQKAEVEAIEQAKAPELMDLARAAAKEAVRHNIEIPLQVELHRDAKVIVRFDGEP